MFAIFLLVLLADVAGAQSLVPELASDTGVVALRSADLQARLESRLQSRVQSRLQSRAQSRVADELSSGRVTRETAKELLSSYRIVAGPAWVAHVRPTRNLFDGYDFAELSDLVALPDRSAGPNIAEKAQLEPVLRNVVEHLGSPAP